MPLESADDFRPADPLTEPLSALIVVVILSPCSNAYVRARSGKRRNFEVTASFDQ